MSETKTVIGTVVGKEEAINKKGDPYFKLKIKEKLSDQYPKIVNTNPTVEGFELLKLNQRYAINVRETSMTLPDGKQITTKWALAIVQAGDEVETHEAVHEERINQPVSRQGKPVKEAYSDAIFDTIGLLKDHKLAIKELQDEGILNKVDLNAMSFSIFKAKRDSGQ